MKVAVLSDSHGYLRKAVISQLSDCTCIIHAGDIIRRADLDELSLYGNLYAIQGNCDRWQPELNELKGILRFQVEGVSFCLVHDPYDVPRDLSGVDVVIHGHTHQYREDWIDGRLWLNPGSCGRARYGGDVTMARLEIQHGKVVSVERIDFRDDEE